ncbi:MAG TPA: hypothetical protein VFP65_05225 [Anaeromyxobacteraceae bacterium]|nr:hypothetical protein [Anaeromyxobacteraceae bacterium]
MTRNWLKAIALGSAMGLAAPALADDAQDTATEKKAQASKAARDMKPGDKTAGDHMDDASDTAKEKTAQTKKKARKTAHKAKKSVHDATK